MIALGLPAAVVVVLAVAALAAEARALRRRGVTGLLRAGLARAQPGFAR